MEAKEMFPVFSQLHEDATQVTERKPGRLLVMSRRKKSTQRKVQGGAPGAQRRDHRIEINYEQEHRTDTQKAILAVAYLLEWSSELGNESVQGVAAEGLAALLRTCCSAVGQMFTIVDLRAAGGNPEELENERGRQ